jgi:hypothetical protein
MADYSSSIPELTTDEQFDDALCLVESLMLRLEQNVDRSHGLYVMEASIIAVATLVLALSVGLNHSVGSLRLGIVSAIVICSSAVIALAMHVALTRPLRRRIERDSRAILDIVSMLREIATLVPGLTPWSETRLRLVATRLSRFPITSSGFS